MAGGVVLPGRRRADGAEDAGADHRADPQHDEIAGAERPLQRIRALAFDQQFGDRLATKQLRHERRYRPSAFGRRQDKLMADSRGPAAEFRRTMGAAPATPCRLATSTGTSNNR